jgi:prophage antirepressor-like protein
MPAAEATSTHYFDGHPFTVILRDGEPWFVATEVAAMLGHRNGPDMTRVLKDRHKGTHSVRTPGGVQAVSIISEPGFYQAVLSRKPTARAMPGMVERIDRFQEWVTEDVLPAIRRTGTYSIPAVAPFDPMEML